jgi:hypothetical protein
MFLLEIVIESIIYSIPILLALVAFLIWNFPIEILIVLLILDYLIIIPITVSLVENYKTWKRNK